MQLHQLQYIVKVSQLNSFSLAAKELFVTQPTLSQQIINLEKELGVKLFERQSKSIVVTPAGKEFVKYAKNILREVDILVEHMKEFTTLERGSIRVGIMWSSSYLGITKNIQIFTDKYSKIDVKLYVDGSHMLPEKLLEREVDAIFYVDTNNSLKREDIFRWKIIHNRMMVILPQSHSLAGKKQIALEELKRETLLTPSTDKDLQQRIEKEFAQSGIRPKVLCESNLVDVMIRLVGEGMGVTFVSEMVAKNMLTDKVVMRPLTSEIDRSIYFAVRKESMDNPIVAEFVKFVISRYDIKL